MFELESLQWKIEKNIYINASVNNIFTYDIFYSRSAFKNPNNFRKTAVGTAQLDWEYNTPEVY